MKKPLFFSKFKKPETRKIQNKKNDDWFILDEIEDIEECGF